MFECVNMDPEFELFRRAHKEDVLSYSFAYFSNQQKTAISLDSLDLGLEYAEFLENIVFS